RVHRTGDLRRVAVVHDHESAERRRHHFALLALAGDLRGIDDGILREGRDGQQESTQGERTGAHHGRAPPRRNTLTLTLRRGRVESGGRLLLALRWAHSLGSIEYL